MSRLTIILLLAALAGSSSRAVGQETRVLTLDRTIEIAQNNSPASRMAKHEFSRADWSHRAFKAGYLPSISLTGNGPGLERSISDILQDDGSVRYVPQSRTFSRIGLQIVQQIPLTGGSVFLSSGLSRVDLFGDIQSNQWQTSPLIIGLSQPLFQHNEMRWEREVEPLRFRASQRAYAEDLAQVTVEITQRFFDVAIAQMDVERAEFNVAVNDTIYTLSEGRYDIGRIAENDLLQSELALLNAQTELSDRRIEYDRALQDLKIALGLPHNEVIRVVPPFEAPPVDVDPDAAVAHARRTRSDFVEMQIDQIDAEQEVARVRSATGLAADVVASYGLNQSSDRLGDAYVNPLNQQRFSIGFTVPIYHWGRSRAQVQSALAQQSQIQESVELRRKELEQEVYFEALRLEQLRTQLDHAAKADTIATRRFEVARNRYTIGKIDITELFIAQQSKDESNQAYIRTLQEFWTSYFRLRQMTLYDIETGRSLVE